MKTWILILVVHWGNGTGITTQEFNSKEACLSAGKLFESQSSLASEVWFNCVEK